MTEIIAEIGVNWSGDLQIARNMILLSKCAGADYVKFQMFNEEVIKGSKYETELSEMILRHKEIKYLSEQARMIDIKFGVSVMYPECFTILEELEFQYDYVPVNFIKIRCKDHCNEKVARPAVKYCNKHNIPLLVSVEKLTYDVDYYRYNLYNTNKVKYLYCVPEYPPELENINNYYINSNDFNGYSNHYPSKYIPMIAVARNLEFVEIHVKRKTNNSVAVELGLYNPQIDENVSINFNDLEEVCDFRNTLSKMR